MMRTNGNWFFDDGLRGRPLVTRVTGTDCLTRHGTRVSVKLGHDRLASMFTPLTRHELSTARRRFAQRVEPPDTDAVLRRGSKLMPALAGWLCPASEVAVYALFADAPREAVVAPNDWMHLGQKALTRRVHCEHKDLVPLRDESGTLLGRVGLDHHHGFFGRGALVLHGIRCGAMPGLVGVALARENNRDARRTEASVAGSTAPWSEWAAQVLGALPNQAIDVLLQLHPLLCDRDLRVWRYGGYTMTLDELVARIVAISESRVHLGEVSHEDDDDMSQNRFDSEFELSDDVVITPKFRPGYRGNPDLPFPWFLGIPPIDYQSHLEAELTRVWDGFEKHEEDGVVGEVEDVEIRRSVTVYRRGPTA